jgi:predicted peptidase
MRKKYHVLFSFISFMILVLFPLYPVVAAQETTAQLADLKIFVTGQSQLKPYFSSAHRRYSLLVQSDVTTVMIQAITVAPNDHLEINHMKVASSDLYTAKLHSGKNKFKITVTNPAGIAKQYSVHIVRENIQPVVDKFLKYTYTDMQTGTTMEYRLFKPDHYSMLKSYPLVLFLHGSGECGTDNEAQLIANQGATIWAKKEEQVKNPCFVLAPQARYTWNDDPAATPANRAADLDMAVKVLQRVVESYHIDKNRLYATGVSDGGSAVWRLNEAYPSLFAAMVPVCGEGDPTQADKIVGKPIWAFHAEADPIVSVEGSRAMIQAVRGAGGLPLYTEYPQITYIYPIAHYSWILAYQDHKMRKWLFQQIKK